MGENVGKRVGIMENGVMRTAEETREDGGNGSGRDAVLITPFSIIPTLFPTFSPTVLLFCRFYDDDVYVIP